MSKRYNPPPNWPQPPEGWTPPPGWTPDPSWGPIPKGWKLYVDDRNWFMRHKILTAIMGIFLLAIVGSALGSGGGGTTTTPSASDPSSTSSAVPSATSSSTPPASSTKAAQKPTPSKKPQPAVAGIGTPVKDGKFQFTVKSVKCGTKRIGDRYLGTTAQGQFCLVSLQVRNIGNEAQTLDGSSQVAYDAKGHKFAADTAAAIYLSNAQTFLNDINPGNAVSGTVVYDVPKGTKLTSVELHDSAFSGGVKVAL